MAGINDNLDKERRDLLNQDLLPTIEMAYAMIRRELARRGIMGTTSSLGVHPSEIGRGLAIKGRSETSLRRDNGDRTYLKCTHYGGSKHRKEGCFKLIGYPEWREEHKLRRAATKATVSRTGGKANLATDLSNHRQALPENTTDIQNPTGNTNGKGKYNSNQGNKEESRKDSNSEEETRGREKDGGRERKGWEFISQNTPLYREYNINPTHLPGPHTTPIPILNHPKGLFCEKENNFTWIFDCGATDTMTYDPSDLISQTHTPRHKIQTANGDFVNVTKAGSVVISLSLQLNNCLLISKLTHKPLSISQLTKELYCTVLMTSTGCTVQDTQTGSIIGRGTER